jgi:hypothetical protein
MDNHKWNIPGGGGKPGENGRSARGEGRPITRVSTRTATSSTAQAVIRTLREGRSGVRSATQGGQCPSLKGPAGGDPDLRDVVEQVVPSQDGP